MIFAVFNVSVIACRHEQVYKLMFCTFINYRHQPEYMKIYHKIKMSEKNVTLMINRKHFCRCWCQDYPIHWL